jgi:hypothetical protein
VKVGRTAAILFASDDNWNKENSLLKSALEIPEIGGLGWRSLKQMFRYE